MRSRLLFLARMLLVAQLWGIGFYPLAVLLVLWPTAWRRAFGERSEKIAGVAQSPESRPSRGEWRDRRRRE
jgi:hypothetical protein